MAYQAGYNNASSSFAFNRRAKSDDTELLSIERSLPICVQEVCQKFATNVIVHRENRSVGEILNGKPGFSCRKKILKNLEGSERMGI